MAFSATAAEIAKLLSGRLVGQVDCGSRVVTGATTDSREIAQDGLFVAREGETTDGHCFLQDAFRNGAAACVVSREWFGEKSETELVEFSEGDAKASKPGCFVVVEDPTAAFGALAGFWRSKLGIPTIAITGSNGKTTTKEMTGAILSRLAGRGTASSKSFNNHIGLPQTILDADSSSSWLLLEAGMNHAGELDYLASIAKPDVASVLNVGPAHLGYFKSLSEIAEAKCEILSYLDAGGAAVLNADDKQLQSAAKSRLALLPAKPAVVTFGSQSSADFRAVGCQLNGTRGLRFKMSHGGETVEVEIAQLGRHNVLNALAACAIALTAFPSLELREVAKAVAEAPAAPMRLELIEVGGWLLVNDAYNANPASMSAALDTAAELAGGKPFGAVLGDMLELGSEGERLHGELGAKAAEAGAALVISVGEYADVISEAARQSGVSKSFAAESPEAAAEKFMAELEPDMQLVLVKGSRRVALERALSHSIPKVRCWTMLCEDTSITAASTPPVRASARNRWISIGSGVVMFVSSNAAAWSRSSA